MPLSVKAGVNIQIPVSVVCELHLIGLKLGQKQHQDLDEDEENDLHTKNNHRDRNLGQTTWSGVVWSTSRRSTNYAET